MKVFLATDMEACAGVLNHDDWVMPEGRFYHQGRRLLTLETNAAAEGLFEGGASEVVVWDGHGAGGIDPELLDERALLIRGPSDPARGYAGELDRTFAALAFVGQHAKAGTPYSHITHTQWFNWIDLSINGVSIGEYGQLALCAMEMSVPTILAAGEEALAREATALTPGVVAVAVKRGLLPDDGSANLSTDEYRAAKLGAVHVSPRRARAMIKAGALQAMRRLQAEPASFRYPHVKPPYVRLARFRARGAVAAFAALDEHPSSLNVLMAMPYTHVQGA